ncbi:MAG: N-acetylmuramoyl-L-alanine amidase [Clostridia bacterium]|nr:N-acetylmuramoyl-L-alanine amidase [Clostridia bacterium]
MGKKFLLTAAILGCVLLAAGGMLRMTGGEIVTENKQSMQGALAGVRVCIDPGHGGYDGGAVGRDSGVKEKAVNLAWAKTLKAALEKEGAQVTLTRSEDVALAEEGKERKRRDLQERVDRAQNADIFLSLHMNEYPDRSQSGPQVFYTEGNEKGRLLAGALQESMNEALSPVRPRSAHKGDYYVLRHQQNACVLIECGFLSNEKEEALLMDAAYRERAAESILRGVAQYLRLRENLANGA